LQFAHQRYVSAPLYLKAGSYELRFEGDGCQGDRASMVDLVCFAPPASTVANSALAGLSTLRAVTGATVRMDFAGSAPLSRIYLNGGLPLADTYSSSHASGIFAGGGSFSSAPANISTWAGASGNWNSAASWESAAVPAGGAEAALRFPAGTADTFNNDISGTFALNRFWASGLNASQTLRFGGNGLSLTNTAAGVMPSVTLSGAGSAELTLPLTVRTNVTIDVSDALLLSGTLSFPLTNSFIVSKAGSGSATLTALSGSPSCYQVNEGKVTFSGTHTGWRYLSTGGPFNAIPVGVVISSLAGKSASFYVTQTGAPVSSEVFFSGLGESVFGTRSGGTVTCNDWFTGFGTAATYDVGAGDTLRILQLLEGVNDASIKSQTSVIKAGPGTAEVRSLGLNTTTRRAYSGQTVIRNGTLVLSADDCGTSSGLNAFNGQTYDGRGGSLGYTLFTNAVRLGDSGTAAGDLLALTANGTGRYIGHNLEIMNAGAGTSLGMTTGTVLYAGDILLHKAVSITGQAGGYMIFNGNITAAPDFAGTNVLALSGLAEVAFNGTLSAGLGLDAGGRILRFGDKVVKTTTLASLALGGTAEAPALLDVDFGSAQNDRISVTTPDALRLSPTRVSLRYASLGTRFAEPGTYTLFTYAGTLNGSVADLSVTNAASNITYTFSNDTANTRILLTLSSTGGSTSAFWTYPGSGAWSVNSNWSDSAVPGGADTAILFGSAIPSASTITLDGPRTAGDIDFNNAAAYTLTGSALTLSKTAGTSVLHVYQGNQILNLEVNSASPVSVVADAGTSLTLSSNAVAKSALSLDAGTLNLRGTRVEGSLSQSAATALSAAATNTLLGGLSGAASATLALSGTAPKLTVTAAGTDTYAGTLSSGTDARLEKTGAGTFTLTGANAAFSGTVAVAQGTLALQSSALPGTLSVTAPAVVSILPASTNGLQGFYYSVTPNTNNFFTLAGMEAHFATLKPDLIVPSSLAGTTFDFGATGALFPQPYGTGGSRTTNFEAVWRGALSVPASAYYTFRITADDGFLLAIDGKQVANRPFYVAASVDGTAYLEAGTHDLVLGYFQATGGSGLQVQVKNLYGTFAMLSNSWLRAYTSVGALSGNGAVTLAANNTQFTAAQNVSSAYSGDLSGPADSLFTKSGPGTLTLSSASVNSNAFAGEVAVQGGVLALTSDERIGNASLVSVASGALLKMNATETIGGLAGAGNITLGGSVYVTAFTGDSDSDISTSKTYTHKLDFPAATASPVINGVTFTSSGLSGSLNGYGWNTTGTLPPASWNSGPTDSTRTGVDSLLWDFMYNSADFTLTLTGLTPGKSYETRFYSRNFANNPRDLSFTFTAGANLIGTIAYNPDTMTRSWVGCRYTADAAGTLSMRIISLNSGNTCHLYGLSNEEVPTTAAVALTLNSPASLTYRHTGALTGAGKLAKQGTGTQSFGGTNSIAAPFDVQAGTLSFEPGASVLSGAVVRAGATLAAPYGNVWLGALSGAGTFSLAGSIPYPTNRLYFVTFTNDAMTDISTSKTYTHKLDFGTRTSPATVINGVTFDKISLPSGINGVINGYGWSNFPATVHGGSAGNVPAGVPAGSGIYNLLYDMFYGMQYPGSATIKLTGLIPGKRYEVRLYNRMWSAGDRTQTLTFDPDGAGPISDAVTFNPDGLTPNFLAYRYTALTPVLDITIASKTLNWTYHLYGISNEEFTDAVNVPVVVDISRNSVLDGVVTGAGGWVKTGAASLTVTGESTATGALAVNAGTFGVAAGGRATAGAISVAAGATLFGDGRMGGNVTVSSNAWLMAGTASSCGTLQIGGSLTLAQGVRLAYRFGQANSNDTVTVGGLLTFPTNGVVQASPLGVNAKAPGKDVFFSSTQIITGPADLSGWTVQGVTKASLKYSTDRKTIYFFSPRGMLLKIL
jgi:autotransporter-associated beta strand protein